MESANCFSNEDVFLEPMSIANYEDARTHLKEPTILEYARFHGLCIDYRLDHPFADQPSVLLYHDLRSDLEDPVGSARSDLTSDFTTKERISISKDSAILLKSVCTAPDLPTETKLESETIHLVARLKQEVPILQSDNELDLREFGNMDIPNFQKLKMSLEVGTERQDEGLEWPTRLLALPAEYERQSKIEKLETSREILLFLQTALKDTFTTEDYDIVKTDALRYKRVCGMSSD